MARVAVTNVEVMDNPCAFSKPIKFEITFDCLAPGITPVTPEVDTNDEGEVDTTYYLNWKVTYVGSANDEKYDQELESFLLGPVEVGQNKFEFLAPAPDASKIPSEDLLGVTVILLTCSYLEQEFIRIGYYVNNDYGDNAVLSANPPQTPSLPHIRRHILADQPRVTRIQINWDEKPNPGFLLQDFQQNSLSAAIIEEEEQDCDMMMDDDSVSGESDYCQSAVDLLAGEEEYRKSREAWNNTPMQTADNGLSAH